MSKKTNASKGSKRTGRQPAIQRAVPGGVMPGMPMDKTMADIKKILASRQFDSIDELNAFMTQMLANNDGRLPEMPPETPLERAQELVYRAYEATTPKRRAELARQAIEISPDCADAYRLLAEMERNLSRKIDLLEQAVAAGERAIGPEAFADERGHFWGVVETRPYMRAQSALAQVCWVHGNRARAIAIFSHLLELNPNDNQGVRYMLVSCLLEERTASAGAALAKLMGDFDDDAGAALTYGQALWRFQENGGPSPAADEALREAIRYNKHVPAFVLGDRSMPAEFPDTVGMGDESEAIDYAASGVRAWSHTPGAIAWLRGMQKG
jgi:tetratricopeptide (TPR) repeat protein